MRKAGAGLPHSICQSKDRPVHKKEGPDTALRDQALALEIIPAATYVPTQLPVQYHRPGEA